ncbi:hypothetical protein EV659_103362 [Rhodothalassium salexigens DSM 2132]|uniref:Divergent polysaccharide deacetylase n=1 Tax=Rhodothalassium salexigens DSM 2132 TaxID=1188247 RepID=A0A4R2PLJ2_RHOSA|nr:divergent polysaccharide deacetylase family protein [Rhodothalassium salexigens]MBB4210872.1 hypothetical protein [Rhodothalassium salexigens DSM 2132]TCP36470.1 hypothetical protein EV659_103362 [Rhodothalassium salexigens DSM 2132]
MAKNKPDTPDRLVANPLKARAEAKAAARRRPTRASGKTKQDQPTKPAGPRKPVPPWRNLALAWGATVLLVVGGALALHLTYSADPAPTDPVQDAPAPETASASPTLEPAPARADGSTAAAAATAAEGQAATQTPSDDPAADEATTIAADNPAPAAPDSDAVDRQAAATDATRDGEPAADERDRADAGTGGLPGDRAPAFDAAPFPDPRYLDSGDYEGLPRRADNGTTPFERYARPAAATDRPVIAVVIVNVGLKKRIGDRILDELPAEITLGISPYAESPQDWATRAHAAGHELLLMVPMEPQDYPRNNPGVDTLKVEVSSARNIRSLHTVMRAFGGYMGTVNHMGSRFTADRSVLRPVLQEIDKRGLMFLDARVTGFSAAGRMASEFGMPTAVNNRFIDAVASPDAIDDTFADLESIARNDGVAVGIGKPLPVTVERIQYWRGRLAAQGISFVPLSTIAGRQTIR